MLSAATSASPSIVRGILRLLQSVTCEETMQPLCALPLKSSFQGPWPDQEMLY